MLTNAYDAEVMTLAIIVDTNGEFLFCTVQKSGGRGEVTPGKLSPTYADLMTEVIVEHTLFFSICSVNGGKKL